MPIVYEDGVWTTAAVHGPKRWHTPFPGTSERVAFEQTYRQYAANFSAVTVGTAHPSVSGFYLASEGNYQGLDAGVQEWVRTYAKIPSSRTEYGSHVYTIPGITPDDLATVNHISGTPSDIGGGLIRITTTGAHGLSVDDIVIITYQIQMATNPSFVPILYNARTIVAVTSTTLDVAEISDPRGSIIDWFSVTYGVVGRDPMQFPVPCRIQYDYFMPGVSPDITTPNDIPIITAVRIMSNDGTETQYYSSVTTPTVEDYMALVDAGEWVVAVDSTLRRWMGNIYERETLYVQAR